MNTKYLVCEYITLVEFVMVSYVANVIKNESSPFSAVTKAIMPQTPAFLEYCKRLLVEFNQ